MAVVPDYWIPRDLKEVLLKDAEPYEEITEKSKKYLNILQKLKKIDRLELSEFHYLQFLKLALYLEEHQQSIDLRKYNLYGKKIERTNYNPRHFKVTIKELDKDHPVQNHCRAVILLNTKDVTKTKHLLRIKRVSDDHMIIVAYPKFVQSYNTDNTYHIRFKFNNYSYRCAHYALSLINSNGLTSYLFPKVTNSHYTKVISKEKCWFNLKISQNPEQKEAVLNIINKSSYPAPYIVYGPPGTGKTATLVEAICQIHSESLSGNILICTPSNAAADVITKRLLQYIPRTSLLRLYSKSRDSSLIADEIKPCINYLDNPRADMNIRVAKSKRIVICTLCKCTRLLTLGLASSYSYVFIDEAGQSTEPDSLIAFNVVDRFADRKCQLIISGDPQQLGPGVRSKYAAPILGQSILERLMKLEPYQKHNNDKYDSCYITKLLRNYRSHPAIITVSNQLYYDNELIPCSEQNPFDSKELSSKFPVIFDAVNGIEEKEKNSTSSYNNEEVKKVLYYVNLLIGVKIGSKEIKMEDIGIVTPFTLQSKLLQKTLKEEKLEDVEVGTVEIFQGQEKEVIILSTVRSKTFTHDNREHLGFLSNRRRFNVALTRAKAILIVVGNPSALQADKNWRHFLQFCRDNDGCRGSKFDLNKSANCSFHHVNDGQRCEKSVDLFEDILHILPINDGLTKGPLKLGKTFTSHLYYNEPRCTIL